MPTGWVRWTRTGATVLALVAVALVLVDYSFFTTMAAATGEGEPPSGWVRLSAIPALAGAILLWRWPLTGVMTLLAATVVALIVAGVAQPTHLYSAGLFFVAAILGALDRRPETTRGQPESGDPAT